MPSTYLVFHQAVILSLAIPHYSRAKFHFHTSHPVSFIKFPLTLRSTTFTQNELFLTVILPPIRKPR